MTIDLSKCKAGDKLVSIHGTILIYVGPTTKDNYYDHFVKYPNGSMGTRINDGHVFKNESKRLQSDEDIVEIIPCASLTVFDEV